TECTFRITKVEVVQGIEGLRIGWSGGLTRERWDRTRGNHCKCNHESAEAPPEFGSRNSQFTVKHDSFGHYVPSLVCPSLLIGTICRVQRWTRTTCLNNSKTFRLIFLQVDWSK